MKQPVLGQRLVSLRKEKNLTQEELVERSHVSVRTIQRIEAGEVIPRLSTIKIIAKALAVDFESIVQTNQNQMEENKNSIAAFFNPSGQGSVGEKTALLTAAIAGIVYLILEIIKTAFDLAWMDKEFGSVGNGIYVAVVICLTVAYFLFMRGFIILGHLFDNGLLKIIAYMLVIGMLALSIFDVLALFYFDFDDEMLWMTYAPAAVIFGVLGIIFGLALLKLQDGMGELSKVAGILEIVVGFFLVTVILFFLAFAIMIPATIVEIVIVYKGYEYLLKAETSRAAS